MLNELNAEDIVTAVVVTYHPDIVALRKNIDQTLRQVDYLVIVDNGSVNQNEIIELVSELSQSGNKIFLLSLEDNKGLGIAHNRGIEKAKELSSQYVLLMDQDSCPQKGMVDSLYKASKHLTDQESVGGDSVKVAAVGPRYTGDGRDDSFFVKFGLIKFKRTYCQDSDENILPADFLISSGSLIALAVLEEVGSMDEGLFIDHVDTEWFLRAQKLGYQSYGVCNAIMDHGLGEKTRTVKLFGLGRERKVPQHKPFRYYYMFRNSIQLYRRGYSKRWIWNDVQRLLQIFIFYGFCYGPRLENLAMMLRGVKDGISGRTGKLV